LLGWEKGQKEITFTSLSKDRIDCKNLQSVQLINGAAGKYVPLTFKQTAEGLVVTLPERTFEELAYVLKLNFKGKIPALDKYAEISTTPYYYVISGNQADSLVLSSDLIMNKKKKEAPLQWKLESLGKGIYKIVNRENNKVLTYTNNGLALSDFSEKENQLWNIQNAYSGLYKISSKINPSATLAVSNGDKEGNKILTAGNKTNGSFFTWQLQEVCEAKVQAFRSHFIPGIVEAEDFNTGCPEEAYSDRDEINSGGEYRATEPVDIEKNEGGYNITRTAAGEWLNYTVIVSKTADYQVIFRVASVLDDAKIHLEVDGKDGTGVLVIPNTGGGQTWKEVKKILKLEEGQHVLKLAIDNRGVHIDKMVFEEIK
jgi:hypothetical protein